MSKRKLAMVAAAASLAIVLAACSGGGSAAPSKSASAKPAPHGSIDFSWWGGTQRNTLTQAVIDLYKKKYPDVTINGSTADFATYFQKASVQAAGKNLPCVPQMQNRTMADYADRHSLMPLDDLVKNGTIDTSNIPKGVLDSGRGADGKLYEIPYGVAFGALMVNTTQVEALGLPLPPKNYTWSWLAKWLKQIHAKTDQPVTQLFGGNSDLIEAWVRGNGEDLFNKEGQLGFSKKTLTDFWTYSEDLRKAGVSDTAQRASEIITQAVEQSDFSKGTQQAREWPANGLQTIQSTLTAVHPDQTVKAYVLPNGSKGNGAALWASGLAISANCDNVDTAASFINFFVNDKEASLAFKSDNGANTQTANLKAIEADPATTPAMKAQLDLYTQLVKSDVRPVVYKKGYASVFNNSGGMVSRYYQQVAFGQLTIKQAVDQLFQEANGQLG
jgi:multiple sugar transport system substrate-binding protein